MLRRCPSQEPCHEPLQLTACCDDAEEKKVAAMTPSVQLPSTRKGGPDGCRSWFIASLCFLVNLLFSSFFRCGGLFFTSMMSTYQATRAQAAMPLGAYCGFVNLSGLVAGALIHSCGMRISALLGGLLMSAGCLASAFATGIPFLVVSIGVITAGRLLIPQLTDYNIASPLGVMTLSYFLMAVIGSAMPHAQTTVVFWILVVTLGLPVGYVMVAMSQTIASDVGLHNLPMAYGFVAAVTAVGAFMRPLVIGYFRDANGSYSGLFHFMGGMVFTSVVLTGWLWVSSTRKNKLKRNALSVEATAE
ncbi:monocarboxylate transporter 12-like [Dermacentor albipictus]|uniref:monocarboxylate transporter 12-like n=1 Tax=Dermacentor albipictus TaxID=60249 RepID=UPI0038FC0576